MSFLRHRSLVLFIVLFIHITVLDLFYVTPSRIVFLWQENAQIETIVVHLLIALLSVALFIITVKAKQINQTGRIKVDEKVWLASSMVFIASIGYMLV